MTREGGCACGAVRYAVDGPLRDVIVCHCRECVDASGHPWAASAVHRRDLTLLAGDELAWRRSPTSAHGASRGRCARCRTVVFWDAPARETVSLGVDTLDQPPALVVAGHVWVSADPLWTPLPDDDEEGGIPAYPKGAPPGEPVVRWVE
jgi:hypothetical protein